MWLFFLDYLILNMKAEWSSETSEILAQEHSVTNQKTCVFSNITVRTSALKLFIAMELFS